MIWGLFGDTGSLDYSSIEFCLTGYALSIPFGHCPLRPSPSPSSPAFHLLASQIGVSCFGTGPGMWGWDQVGSTLNCDQSPKIPQPYILKTNLHPRNEPVYDFEYADDTLKIDSAATTARISKSCRRRSLRCDLQLNLDKTGLIIQPEAALGALFIDGTPITRLNKDKHLGICVKPRQQLHCQRCRASGEANLVARLRSAIYCP